MPTKRPFLAQAFVLKLSSSVTRSYENVRKMENKKLALRNFFAEGLSSLLMSTDPTV